ncbi:restriction endonuclease subunit S [Leptospira montravelensis]|uniref:Restriction endonuclease subunit S n=1 Tax=Leptospira montravelensis TaxID=2484961 RepID=A0ABY2LVW8_9LEPT|nr:restriction endonuclease subunit S [Leptospira montravelensis]TGK78191.1 restriction endonuclease subunit S [Leptospira montravelensis]TGL03763.1 restriction endonuclease subunit S [Leptospira montravelensis]
MPNSLNPLLQTHFDTALEHPNGIKKLRELILTLAMQGKLVPQDPNDQASSELLKEIQAEKARLVAEGKVKKTEALLAVKEEEKPFVLPKGWEWVRLGDVSVHNSGKTLDKGRNSGIHREYITTSNLYWGFFELEELRQMPFREEELFRCTATKGDLLICEGGEAGRAAVWNYDKDICFQNHIHRVRFLNKGNPYYFFRFFQKLDFTGEIKNYRKGVAISSISSATLGNISLPLPPLTEQKRIVEKIDELFLLCDELETLKKSKESKRKDLHQSVITQMLEGDSQKSFQKHFQFLTTHFQELYSVKENVKELRKAVLQLAVMGKLVEQDPKDQPANELLKEIQAEKARLVAEGKVKKSESLPPVKEEEKPFVIPEGWEWVRLGEVCEAVDYGTSEKANTSKGVPILRMNNIQDGKLDISNLKFVSEKIKDLPRLFLKNLDLIFNRTNSYELVGKTAIFYGEEKSVTLASYLIRATIFKYIHIEYLNFYMNSRICRLNEIEPHITQQTNQANFSGSKLKMIKVPLPPLAEQKRIVEKVDQLLALCDELEERIGKAEEKRGEILEGMVRGE